MGLLGVARTGLRALRGDDQARYLLAERLGAAVHPDAIVSDRDRYWLHDREFRAIYDRFEPEHRRRLDRVWLLRELAKRAAHMAGDTAECGVYTGLSSFVIASAASKTHHAFDSFAGLSEPGDRDGAFWTKGDLSTSLDIVRSNLAELPNIEFYPGWIPERFAEIADRKFALVHIDVDLAEPTDASIRFFGDRMAPGGVIVLDDYGMETCPGARAVATDFASERGLAIVEAPTGQGLILDAGGVTT